MLARDKEHSLVTLVQLGTIISRYDWSLNLFFETRVDKSAEIYHCNGISKIIVSGNYNRRAFNEARDMQMALIKRGVAIEGILIDDESFRTYDTFLNLKKKFGLGSCVIVSQSFHNKRALYITASLGMRALACKAADLKADNFFYAQLREIFARVKTLIAIHIFRPRKRKWSSG